ncbi:GIY-YIG nuclease family protein [Butyrivibrio sp. XB500-5]|uniref:GIY-YIG nuclease family protein n=1 Tax=Butyrivibrio sp. XB500-5 TaxID=2364880 RepID=UPI001314C5FD|nr:GIY-YIG nuclease family protein [Butyrivibrio sp. XB500-5]
MAYGKSVNLFLVNGKADSLVIAELKNWDAKAIRIPRIEVPSCDRAELQQQGVYFLICFDPNTGDRSVYIGEADNVKSRLIQHIQAYKADKEDYYWNSAICFTAPSLNKTFVRYIENKCFDIAKRVNRYGVLTQQTYSNTIISEADQAAMDEFIDNMQIVLGALGCEALEPLNAASADGKSDADRRFTLTMGGVKAVGEATADGFVVFKGATINPKTNTKSLNKNAAVRRDAMIASDKVDNNTTTEDILFTSPSAAADFLVGYSVSGPANWKDKKGTALKDRTDI